MTGMRFPDMSDLSGNDDGTEALIVTDDMQPYKLHWQVTLR
jgi:hypothetical protein